MLVEFRGLQGEKLFITPAHVMFVTNAEEQDHAVLILTNGLEIAVVPAVDEAAKKIAAALNTTPRK